MGRTKLSVVLIIVCAVKCLSMTYDELEDFAEHLKKTSQLSPTLKKGVDPEMDYDEEEGLSDHAWEDSGKFEGDLILNDRQRRLIVEDVAEGLARNGIRDGTKRWPNNEVIYFIQVEHFNSDQVRAIESGIQDLALASCVKFRRYRKGDRDAVVIQGSRRGCFSQVGYQGGYQVLNLSGRHPVGRGCFRHGTVVHELLHTLGFYHMQSSPDRDDYVNVIWANIVQPARHNFRKYNLFSVSDFGVGYDYDSVLHYSQRAFSANGQDTIVPKQRGATIGQRVGLSDKDTQKLNKMYCDADSDSVQADENPSRKTETKKKNGKNKPFEGQGIGYHQGKAVAIKLLPAAETYKLPDVPSFHVFDYFSKEPQILSPSEIEGFRIGKEITYSYNPSEPLATQENNTPVDFDTESETKPDLHEVKLQGHHDNHDNVAEVKQVNGPYEKKLSDSKHAVDVSSHNGYTIPEAAENVDPDLINAFDRLSKIIKLHVYPSQTPDLSIYKMNEHYTNHYYPPEVKEESMTLISPAPITADKSGDDKMNSAISFINNLYFTSEKSRLEKPDHGKMEKYKQTIKNMEDASVEVAPDSENIKIPNSLSFPLHKHYENKYISIPAFESSEYKDKKEYARTYSPKVNNYEKSNEDQDEWYQKYVPYHPGHDEHYMDYSKDSSREPEYDSKKNENIYSSSFPIKTQDYSRFQVPARMTKNWFKITDASNENR